MTGTITNINRDKGFAFARPDDGSEDVFVAFREIRDDQRQQLAKDSRVEFTVGTAADGKKRPALNVRLITDAPSGNTPSPTAAPAADNQQATSQNRPPMKYVEGVVAGIELVFSEPNLLVYFQANYGGVDATLLVDGNEMETGMTDFEGRTEFLLEIPADAKKRVVEILVADGKTPYRKIWLRNPPKPAEEPAAETKVKTADESDLEPAEVGKADATADAKPEPAPESKPPSPPKLEVKLQFREGPVYTYRVTTAPESCVVLKSACKIQARLAGTAVDWTCSSIGRQHTINAEAENAGVIFDIEVNLATPGDRGVVEFHANNLEHEEYLRNDNKPATPAAI